MLRPLQPPPLPLQQLLFPLILGQGSGRASKASIPASALALAQVSVEGHSEDSILEVQVVSALFPTAFKLTAWAHAFLAQMATILILEHARRCQSSAIGTIR